jgi:hypothetical protein
MSTNITSLKRKLMKKVQREKDAMTRLRRAQTWFDKLYSSRLRTQERIFEAELLVSKVIDRLK